MTAERVKLLTALGYKPHDPDEPPEEETTWTKSIGWVVIQVTLAEWDWVKDDTTYGHTVRRDLATPDIQAHLPHSCDEWVIAGPHNPDPVKTLLDFSTDLADAAVEVTQLKAALS